MSPVTTGLPNVVSDAEWRVARDALLKKEKEMTRARDALAAERRRLPMTRVEKDYVFEGPEGKVRLLDLTPFGRQEQWEDSPVGRPQSPTYGWARRHDEY